MQRVARWRCQPQFVAERIALEVTTLGQTVGLTKARTEGTVEVGQILRIIMLHSEDLCERMAAERDVHGQRAAIAFRIRRLERIDTHREIILAGRDPCEAYR